MDRDVIKGWIGCLIPIIALTIYVVVFRSCRNNEDKVYLVENTNYIHCSKEDGSCKFIDQAKEKGYKIKTVDLSSAPYSEYKICRLCFSPQKVQDYDRKLKDIKEIKLRIIRESDRKDSLINSVSDEVREAIIEDYLESLENDDDGYYPDDDVPHGRFQ